MLKKKLVQAMCLATSLVAIGQVQARVTAVDIVDEQKPTFEGKAFGDVGEYQRIKALVHFAIDPTKPEYKAIVDLDKAAKNDKGEVEFSSEVVILQPSDASKANNKLFFEIANRGRNLSFPLVNDSPYAPNPMKAEEAGNGYLMKEGYTIVWSGWQPDLGDAGVSVNVPIAEGVTGSSREEFIFDKDEAESKGALTYPAADLDLSKATLTVRSNEHDERKTVEGLSFSYVSPTEITIKRPAGLPAGAIYEFIYPAKDSKVTGLGFIATRDLVSFLRGSKGHDVKPPVAKIDSVIGMGISQAGRFGRDFVYQGFNADENGDKVFDGLMVHIAGSRKTFTNYRFAQPGRYSRQHEDHAYPGDQFPFTYADTTDALTGKTEGILTRCSANNTCPKVMHSDTDTEFWQARASLVVTDTAGKPVAMPDDVRVYYFSSLEHFTIANTTGDSPTCVFQNNTHHVGAAMRGLVAGMDGWLSHDTAPPSSRFPNQIGTTLVKPEDLTLPAIPQLSYKANINRLYVMDHSVLPPKAGKPYPIFVGATGVTGNVIGGIRLPRIDAPLATHMGWSLRDKGFAEGELCSLTGSYIPFAKTAKDKAEGDSRPAISELYADSGQYLAAIDASINDLLAQRLILNDDVDMLRNRAKTSWEEAVK